MSFSVPALRRSGSRLKPSNGSRVEKIEPGGDPTVREISLIDVRSSTTPMPAAADPTGTPVSRSSPHHTSEMITNGVALTG